MSVKPFLLFFFCREVFLAERTLKVFVIEVSPFIKQNRFEQTVSEPLSKKNIRCSLSG